MKWLIAAVVTLLIVGTAAGATLMLTASAGNADVLAWTPADSIVYAEARLDLPGDQRAELAKTMKAFPGFDDQAAFPVKLNEALDMLVGKASDGKMSYQADIAPWFGGQVGVSIGPIPASADASAARGLVLVGVTDATKAGAWASKVLTDAGATTSTEPYNGVTINVITPPAGKTAMAGAQVAWATFGPVMALGDTTSVKAAIDTKGTAGLPTVDAVPDRGGVGPRRSPRLRLRRRGQPCSRARRPWPGSPLPRSRACRRSWTTCRPRGWRPPSAPRTARSSSIRRPLTRRRWVRRRWPSRSCRRSFPRPRSRSSRATTWAATLQRAKALLAKEPALADGVKQVDDTLALLGGFGAIVDWMDEVGIAVTVDGDKVAGGIVATPLDPAAPDRLFSQLRGLPPARRRIVRHQGHRGGVRRRRRSS